MIEEAVGRYLLLLGEGGIEDALRGGSTRWLRSSSEAMRKTPEAFGKAIRRIARKTPHLPSNKYRSAKSAASA